MVAEKMWWHDVDKSKIDVIIIIRMMSELNTGSKLEDSSLHSTQAFILRRIQNKEVGMVSMNMSGAGVIFEFIFIKVDLQSAKQLSILIVYTTLLLSSTEVIL